MNKIKLENRDPFNNTSFSYQLTDGFNKLENYAKLGWSVLQIANALVYFMPVSYKFLLQDRVLVRGNRRYNSLKKNDEMNKVKLENGDPSNNTSFSPFTIWFNKLEYYIKLGWIVLQITKRSSLFYDRKLQIFIIGQSFCPWEQGCR